MKQLSCIFVFCCLALLATQGQAADFVKGCQTGSQARVGKTLSKGSVVCLRPLTTDVDSTQVLGIDCSTFDVFFDDNSSGLQYNILRCMDGPACTQTQILQNITLDGITTSSIYGENALWIKVDEVGDGNASATTPILQLICSHN